MKIISFEYLGEKDGYHLGEIETVEWFFFKKKMKVFKVTSYWRFMDTGKFTPNEDVEQLHLAWAASQKLKEMENK